MLTQSVAVVRNIDEAVAGSKPMRFSSTGTSTPESPLAMHENTIAANTTKASVNGCG